MSPARRVRCGGAVRLARGLRDVVAVCGLRTVAAIIESPPRRVEAGAQELVRCARAGRRASRDGHSFTCA